MVTQTPITDTTLYPPFTSKALMMAAIKEGVEARNEAKLTETLYRISNTDTSSFSDATARHDA